MPSMCGLPTDIHWDLRFPLSHPILCSPCMVETLERHTKVHIIPSYCTMGRTGQTGVVPKCPLCYALYLLSIPSHCTMGGTGQTRVVPKCPLCYALYLLSIPSHCTMGGDGWDEICQLSFIATTNTHFIRAL